MNLQEALAASMDGPFGIGHAETTYLNLVDGLTDIVVSTEMEPGYCVIRHFYGHSWELAFLSPEQTFDWNPCCDENTVTQVKRAYEHIKEARP